MMKLNLQFFAHKKGVGSTKNGRDSESKRLGAKRADGQFVKAGNILYSCLLYTSRYRRAGYLSPEPWPFHWIYDIFRYI